MLISFLRARICAEEISEAAYENLTEENLEKLFKLSKKHDVAQIVADTLFKNKLISDGECTEKYKSILIFSVWRYQMQNRELRRVCDIFEENGIAYIPLKGSVLRAFYPDPWLRTSCDIDILVHEEDLERAVSLLKDNAYLMKEKGPHDVSFYSENDVHIELHYNVIEEEFGLANVSNVLSYIWDYTELKNGYNYQYLLSNEMFYFYHIAHMAKHFVHGGCGVRPFLDLWLINKNMSFDNEKKIDLLKKGGILTFAETTEQLVSVWFSNEAYTDVVSMMENYIFSGGIYGNLENQVAMNQAKTDSKFKSAWAKIFLDYDTIKFHYPILQKHKWLLPIMEVRRWCKLIFLKEHRKRSVNHININQNLSEESKAQAKNLREYLGI